MATQEDVINAYYDGIREGIWNYAYMKDGTYYVGTTGRTFKEAAENVEIERQRVLLNETKGVGTT